MLDGKESVHADLYSKLDVNINNGGLKNCPSNLSGKKSNRGGSTMMGQRIFN